MVFRLMKRGWGATKPPISDDLYFRVFNDALFYAAEYRDMDTIMTQLGYTTEETNFTTGDTQRILNEMYQEFSQLEAAMRNLEEIKPRAKELLDVHVAMVGFLRAFLLVQDRFTMNIIEDLKGNSRQAKKRRKEAQQWASSLENARQLLRKKIAEMERKRPDVLIGLKLSASCLEDLGLR